VTDLDEIWQRSFVATDWCMSISRPIDNDFVFATAKTDHNSSYIQRILMISVRNTL